MMWYALDHTRFFSIYVHIDGCGTDALDREISLSADKIHSCLTHDVVYFGSSIGTWCWTWCGAIWVMSFPFLSTDIGHLMWWAWLFFHIDQCLMYDVVCFGSWAFPFYRLKNVWHVMCYGSDHGNFPCLWHIIDTMWDGPMDRMDELSNMFFFAVLCLVCRERRSGMGPRWKKKFPLRWCSSVHTRAQPKKEIKLLKHARQLPNYSSKSTLLLFGECKEQMYIHAGQTRACGS